MIDDVFRDLPPILSMVFILKLGNMGKNHSYNFGPQETFKPWFSVFIIIIIIRFIRRRPWFLILDESKKFKKQCLESRPAEILLPMVYCLYWRYFKHGFKTAQKVLKFTLNPLQEPIYWGPMDMAS